MRKTCFKPLVSAVVVLLMLIAVVGSPVSAQGDAAAAISSAKNTILSCYNAAKAAETAGANITTLTDTLNEAGSLLSQAELEYSRSDFAAAASFAVQSQNKLNNFVAKANSLRGSAAQRESLDFLVNVVGSLAGAFAVVGVGVAAWVFLKKRPRTTGRMQMLFQKYKAFFFIVVAITSLFVASPAIQRLLVYPQTDFFTELWLLGPQHRAENLPFNITRNEEYNVFLGVANHLGHCAYYLLQVKFRNQTQPAADSFSHTFSSVPSLYAISAFVADEATWELPISFAFDYSYGNYNETLMEVRFNGLRFNDVALNINGYASVWDPQLRVFFGNLFVELWIYDSTVGSFQYHDRFVGLGFNMTMNS